MVFAHGPLILREWVVYAAEHVPDVLKLVRARLKSGQLPQILFRDLPLVVPIQDVVLLGATAGTISVVEE